MGSVDETTGVLTMMAAWGETAIYRPRSGMPRTITVIVDRDDVAAVNGAPSRRSPSLTVYARNDPLAGIDLDTLDTGGDQLDLARRVGGDLAGREISRLVSQDAGLIAVEVR